jgi:hypothetical protein
MPNFDVLRFFREHNIEFHSAGRNVSSGNVVIHCPFCGSGDHGAHLSVNISKGVYRCFRDPSNHKGGPLRLVQALIGCTYARAQQIIGYEGIAPEADLYGRVKALLDPDALPPSQRTIKFPKDFRRFDPTKMRCIPFLTYLNRRGIDTSDPALDTLSDRYCVRYAVTGPYRNRIIFPVHYHGKLITWTGRTISSKEEIRYKTLSTDLERAWKEGTRPAIDKITNCLLWYDVLWMSKAHTVVLVEGPFDALKVNILGSKHGICATCFFTSVASENQMNLLHVLLPRFKHRYLMLDQGTMAKADQLAAALCTLDVEQLRLPDHIDDPGDLDEQSLLKLCGR